MKSGDYFYFNDKKYVFIGKTSGYFYYHPYESPTLIYCSYITNMKNIKPVLKMSDIDFGIPFKLASNTENIYVKVKPEREMDCTCLVKNNTELVFYISDQYEVIPQ